jgi:phage terminase Nu1 subunit (DNA packaging protein)
MARPSRKASRKRKPAGRKRTPPRQAQPSGTSLRALARALGVSHTAVVKGVESGRLARSVGRLRGRPVILDVGLAAEEWAAGATKPNPAGPESPSSGPSLTQAQIRLAEARAEGISLSNEIRSGRVILAETARNEAFESARTIRDAVLAVPDRLAAELAGETDARRCRDRMDEELRNALAGVADVLANAS